MKRVQVIQWMALISVACDGGQRAETESASAAAPSPSVALLNRWELEAYAAGTAAEIGLLRKAIQSGIVVDWRALDSAGAAAAGVSAAQFHAISVAVDAVLRARFTPTQPAEMRLAGEAESTFVRSAARLDSLRIDLMMLRLRANGFP